MHEKGLLLKALEENNPTTFQETLDKHPYLLREPLKDEKDMLTLVCESDSLEILQLVLEKLDERILQLPSVKNNEYSLWSSWCHFEKDKTDEEEEKRINGAKALAKAFQWKKKYTQTLLTNAVKNNDLDMVKTTIKMGAEPTDEVLFESASDPAQYAILEFLMNERLTVNNEDIFIKNLLIQLVNADLENEELVDVGSNLIKFFITNNYFDQGFFFFSRSLLMLSHICDLRSKNVLMLVMEKNHSPQ